MKLEEFESITNETCTTLPAEVQTAIQTIIKYAKDRKTMPFTDRVDTFLSILEDKASFTDLSLCLREY